MPAAGSSNARRYVTHDEFQDFRREFNDDLNRFRGEFRQFASEMHSAIEQVYRPNYQVWVGVATILVMMLSLAGALIAHALTSQYTLNAEVTRGVNWKIEDTRKSVTEMDTTMQREMRLLDEVLQRELALHINRVDALIAVNKEHIQKLEDRGE